MSQVFSIEPIVMMNNFGFKTQTQFLDILETIQGLMEGKGSKKSQGGGSGVLSAPCDQDATLMVQNLYSERELSIKL